MRAPKNGPVSSLILQRYGFEAQDNVGRVGYMSPAWPCLAMHLEGKAAVLGDEAEGKTKRSDITPDPGGHRQQRPCAQGQTLFFLLPFSYAVAFPFHVFVTNLRGQQWNPAEYCAAWNVVLHDGKHLFVTSTPVCAVRCNGPCVLPLTTVRKFSLSRCTCTWSYISKTNGKKFNTT